MKRRKYLIFTIGALAVIASLTATDLFCGTAATDSEIIRFLRLPRAITAILSGAALALAGTQMQCILRNPLADPHIMGVSSGAALGTALATMWGNSGAGLTVAGAAFAGAVATASIIMVIAKRFRSADTLLIFGVMLGFITNAIISILQFSSDGESLKTFYSWSAGSFSTTTWAQIGIITLALIIGFTMAIRNHKNLDIILFGDEFAEMAGADTGRIRIIAMLGSCMLTAAVTAFCGPLGFVGIVSPHIARGLLGTAVHHRILPASMLIGSIISLGANIVSQLASFPLPTASTMAIIGIPAIFYIILKRTQL